MRSALLLLLVATGCCRPEVVYRTVETPVPVPCPAPPPLAPPALPVDGLVPGATPDHVARAYVMSVAILRQKLREAYALLDVYRR